MPETTSTPAATPSPTPTPTNPPPTTPAAPQTSSAPTSTATPDVDASLLAPSTEAQSEPSPDQPAGAPEAYADFRVPEGYTLDKSVVDEASPIFKELNLSQDGAQKLVDLYLKHNAGTVKAAYDTFRAERTRWAGESQRWLDANGGKDAAVQSLGRALNTIFAKADGTPDADAIAGFRHFMDSTGGGDNPYAVRAMITMAKQFVEARPVATGGPSPFGQTAPDQGPRTLAQRLYPNGPRSGRYDPNANQPQGG